MWTKLSADTIPAGPITLQVETELALVDFGALYRLGEWSLGRGMSHAMAEGEPQLAMHLYAGGRLTYIQAEIGVGAHFTAATMGLLGYRAFWQNYETRTDGSLFRWDVTMHGPTLGLTIRF